MIRLSAQYCHGSIDLLCEKKPYHLVGKCHPAQRQFGISPAMHLITETIRATNHKHNSLQTGYRTFLYKAGKFTRCHLAAMLIEKHHSVARLQSLNYFSSLTLLLHTLVESA